MTPCLETNHWNQDVHHPETDPGSAGQGESELRKEYEEKIKSSPCPKKGKDERGPQSCIPE